MKPKNNIDLFFQDLLKKKEESGNLRRLSLDYPSVDFCSNDYLGVARKKINRDVSALKKGVGGSRLIGGNSSQAEKLEQELAEFFDSEDSLLFSSGYQANLGLISCIAQRNDTILYDQFIHASIRDGIQLSNAKNFSFNHNDLEDLSSKINRCTGNVFVVIESIYSMDGDIAPLSAIAAICESKNISLIVDEAHAIGWAGEKGEGLVHAHNLQDKVWARVVTFGKTYGTHGAAILGNAILKQYLINFSRPFIFSTGMSPISVHEIEHSLSEIQEMQPERLQLLENIHFFIQKSKEYNSPIVSKNVSPIQWIKVESNDAVLQMAEKLQHEGIHIKAVRHPAVPKGQERLRICLHSYNTREQIEFLFKVSFNE